MGPHTSPDYALCIPASSFSFYHLSQCLQCPPHSPWTYFSLFDQFNLTFFQEDFLNLVITSLVSVTSCLLLYYILYWGQSLGNMASLWRLGKGALSGQIRPEVHQSTWLWGQRTDQAQPFFPISFVPLCSEPCTEPDEVALTQSLVPEPDHTWGRDFVWTPPSKSF